MTLNIGLKTCPLVKNILFDVSNVDLPRCFQWLCCYGIRGTKSTGEQHEQQLNSGTDITLFIRRLVISLCGCSGVIVLKCIIK